MLRSKINSGFTLIELLVVIGIIAILSTVALLNFSAIQAKSRGNQAKTDIANIVTEMETYKASHSNTLESLSPPIDKSVTESGDPDWTTFLSQISGCSGTSCPVPPASSGITYEIKIESPTTYYICAENGNITRVTSNNQVWVGSNGNLYESATCGPTTG